MIQDPRIPLREAALRLAGYPQFRKTNTRGRRELLRLLQTEQIRAAFHFPSKAGPGIDITGNFWMDTKSGHFDGQLISNSRRGKHGQFLVKPVKFIDQYTSWFSDNYLRDGISTEKRMSADAVLASALANIRRSREAYILESEWARFVTSKVGVEQANARPPKSTRGKRALTSWDVVLVEVAVELLRRQMRGQRVDEPLRIAEIALKQSKDKLAENNPPPEVGTVAKKSLKFLNR
jgi:hypothetical protein